MQGQGEFMNVLCMYSVLGIKFICKYEIGLSEKQTDSGFQRMNGIQSEVHFTRTWFDYFKQSPIANSL